MWYRYGPYNFERPKMLLQISDVTLSHRPIVSVFVFCLNIPTQIQRWDQGNDNTFVLFRFDNQNGLYMYGVRDLIGAKYDRVNCCDMGTQSLTMTGATHVHRILVCNI
jgi:hypothetical protein